ncbi:MAG: hypothetical protein QF440_05615 [Candidatus Thalassarchaeaceae archaeon]|nr:hypothetical protein [Candidatus Thalassarchaeaceae archaeon]
MERYYPRAGLACALFALALWCVFLFNGVLGFFPSIIFADGGIGSKFHFWFFIEDRLLGGSANSVWSEAGVMTGQEWFMLSLAIPLSGGALFCLRHRPEFGNIDSGDLMNEREQLEMSTSSSNTSGTGNANTAAIIDSVISKEGAVDESTVAAALGEMGEMAAAYAAEMKVDELDESEDPILDSRFTTVVDDGNSMEIASAAASEKTPIIPIVENNVQSKIISEEEIADDPFDDWPVIETVITSKSKDKDEGEKEVEDAAKKSVLPSLSEITDKISAGSVKAVEVSTSAVHSMASMAAKVKNKIVGSSRKPKSTVMPVRPENLPPMAEWDENEGEWVLFGRPIRIAPKIEPVQSKPDWVTESEDFESDIIQEQLPLLQAKPISNQTNKGTPAPEENLQKRNVPKIPKLF